MTQEERQEPQQQVHHYYHYVPQPQGRSATDSAVSIIVILLGIAGALFVLSVGGAVGLAFILSGSVVGIVAGVAGLAFTVWLSVMMIHMAVKL